MDRNRDLRRTAVSAVNGLPRRRQRITTLRDSPEMELQETVRSRDRERSQKKDLDRELPKRRKVDWSGESTDSSDEEYYEEEDEMRNHHQNRMNQPSNNNRRGIRTLRSSPVLRAAVDEMIGVPVPRRARSSSAKRLHEYSNSGGIGENLSHRRFSPFPATEGLVGSAGASPSYSGVPMKKKKKSVEPRTRVLNTASSSRPSSEIQDEIEIEVAEALFDLMKQSQSQLKPKNVDRDITNAADDELKRLKAEDVKDGDNDFSAQNEQSVKVNGETIVVDSMDELKKAERIEEEKFAGQELLVGGDGFVNKGEAVGSPKEKESSSCVKVNACDILDPSLTNAENLVAVVEAKKETKLEIDLMGPPPPSSPERDASVDAGIDPKVLNQDLQKKSETISKDTIQLQKEKIGAISESGTQQQQDTKEQKNQSPWSFPVGTSAWPCALPYPGCMPPPPQAVLPIDVSPRSSTITHLPQFKFSQPRRKRCASHQCIAHNIRHHQQLINKSLSSGPSNPATLYGTKPLNLKSFSPTQTVIPLGQTLATKDKSSDAATSSKLVLQQSPHQAPSNNFLHAPGFIFPLDQHQTTMMAPVGLPSNSAGRPSMNFSNYPVFPSSEASPYMAIFQSNNVPLKGGPQSQSPAMPFFNSSFYPSRMFNTSQSQQQFVVQPPSQNTNTSSSSSHKQTSTKNNTSKPDTETTRRNGGSVNNGSFPVQSLNFAVMPPGSNTQQQQGSNSKGTTRVDLTPQQAFALSFGSNPSMTQNSAIFNGYQMSQQKNSQKPVNIQNFQQHQHQHQQQLIQLQRHHMQQMLAFPSNNPVFSQVPVQTDNNSSFPAQWENLSSQSATKSSQGQQTHIMFGNSSQGQQFVINGQPSLIMSPSNTSCSLRTGTTMSTLPSQESDSSQKTSPTCRRNVTSILSTCPTQLPELKY